MDRWAILFPRAVDPHIFGVAGFGVGFCFYYYFIAISGNYYYLTSFIYIKAIHQPIDGLFFPVKIVAVACTGRASFFFYALEESFNAFRDGVDLNGKYLLVFVYGYVVELHAYFYKKKRHSNVTQAGKGATIG